MIAGNAKSKVLEYFFLNPTARLRVRQIERDAKVTLPSAIRYASELEKEGILKKVVVGGVVFYAADRASKDFLREKMLFNIRRIKRSGLVEALSSHYHNPAIILFGSCLRGEDTEGSDIDIYVESRNAVAPDLSSYERILCRKVQLFVNQGVKTIKNKELANNILNGLVLNGWLEVF